MSFPHDIQPNIMDCGATCLRIIGRYYGRSFPLSYLRNITYTTREGASMQGLSKGAETLGFRTMGVKISFDKLQQEAPLPLIAYWNQNHFVVVYKISKTKVYISDPGNGLLTYTHEQFIRQWIGPNATRETEDGIVLLFETTPEFNNITVPESTEAKIDAPAFLYHYIKPHRKLLLQVLLSLGAASILQLIVPFLTQNIVDTGIYKKDVGFIWLVLIAQLMITIGGMVLDILRGWMLLHISSRINISLISDFFIKLMKLPIRYFDTRLSGDLMQRIQDHHRIESFLTNTTLSVLFSLFTLVLYGAVLAWYSVALFTVFIIGSILYLGWILFFLKRREKLDYKRFQQAGATQSKVMELINGMQEIKLHNAEQQKRWEWERIQVKLFRISLQSMSLEQVQSSGSRIINEVKNILVSVIAATLVIDGKLTLGMMLSVSYIIGQLNNPVLQLVGVIKSWQDARISLDRLTEIHQKTDEQPVPFTGDVDGQTIVLETSMKKPLPADHTLFFNEVSFSYDELSDPVLKNVILEIPAGKVTAIVGSSGSGKTTLMKLLMRFYEPSSGKLYIANTELNKVDITDWRHHCGVVMQEGFIFNDTIAGNIAVGDETPDYDRLREAARLANIHTFIDALPLGYNTKIGQEGIGISTGQKQRLLIARAIYKNPDILFFDEATSALDANNERQIMENLEQFYQGKTVVVIAHRLSTVRHADNIVVLEDGTITEQGTHEVLTALKGGYYDLVKNQLELGN
jgi:ATP-binding cassette subfamily B protein